MKQSLYPKTKRIGKKVGSVVSEKLDGSNLGFFKFEGELYIAQRNNIFSLAEIASSKEVRQKLYKGLVGWLVEHEEELEEELQEGACVFGEWIGMGRLKYNFSSKWFQFAKGNVVLEGDVFVLKNIYYDHELFKWSYVSQKLPDFLTTVPLVVKWDFTPTVSILDELYSDYTEEVERNVEGFVVYSNRAITKYVRMKNGSLTNHKE